ncbi:hypothetical protein L3Y34_014816 [Caenorhabditis briggsae]|uniref:Uncharacterized protein n=1 Tax=Caenorhabditis briggsae TaxID=6238 RepID=A0AAE9IY36_CAEBR|nr:hypothetical protein L3Y34_014816 [Caenorhabditis briggsae]
MSPPAQLSLNHLHHQTREKKFTIPLRPPSRHLTKTLSNRLDIIENQRNESQNECHYQSVSDRRREGDGRGGADTLAQRFR